MGRCRKNNLATKNRFYLRTIVALSMGCIAVTPTLYLTQAMLPEVERYYHIGIINGGFSISVTVFALALSLTFYGALSDWIGRRVVIVGSALMLGLPTLLASVSKSYDLFLVCRAFQGIFLGGIYAIATAYIGEEFPRNWLRMAMGFYIGSMALGGLLGRVVAGIIAAQWRWQLAFVIFGLLVYFGCLIMFIWLPASEHFRTSLNLKKAVLGMGNHFKMPQLFTSYFMGFLILFSFVGIYTYVAYYLEMPPLNLSEKVTSLVFLTYVGGIVSSSINGILAEKFGLRTLISAGLILGMVGMIIMRFHVISVIVGLCIMTVGFFIAQANANCYVQFKTKQYKGSSSAMYFSFYYTGGGFGAFLPGYLWKYFGWNGVISICLIAFLLSLAINKFWLKDSEIKCDTTNSAYSHV